jgi:hypothetical protein
MRLYVQDVGLPHVLHINFFNGGIILRINLLNEKFIENNDLYVLECHQGTVIVNENYSGIKLYNEKLELNDTIDIFEGILIHAVYKNPNKNEVILYCPDNEVFVYLNLDTSFQKVIKFIGHMDECGLSNIYFWSGDEVLFLGGNKKYYKIIIGEFHLQELTMVQVGNNYPILPKLIKDSENYLIFEGGTETLTYGDRRNHEIVFFDYRKNMKIVSKIPNNLGHEVIYLDGLFLSIHEEFIQAIKDGKNVARIETVTPYTFLKAKKQTKNNANFIVLKGNISNTQECFLSCYEITY